MPDLTILSSSGQVAAHVREELLRGRWNGMMPGARPANVSGGKDDRRQTLTKAEFVEGETVGPTP